MLLLASAPFTSAQTTPWQVANAESRFQLEITTQPTEPCAGIVALLPDGGLLGKPTPGAVVLDASGKELRSECLWSNPAEGLALVFTPPTTGNTVFVYFRSGATPTLPAATSPFCPSLLLYTQTGKSSLEAARALARETPAGRGARVGLVDAIGERENPFGPDDYYLSYYTGWIKPPKPGTYYLATISDEGSEVAVDGRVVAAWPGLHTRDKGARGQYGADVNLNGERYRIEYYHFEQTGPQEMHLVWRTPDAKPNDLPVTVPGSAFIHSGEARLVAGGMRTGAALAAIEIEADSYLWLGQKPLNLYRLRAPLAGKDPAGTVYSWDLGDGLVAKGKEILWLIEGETPLTTTLTVTSPGGSTKASRAVYYDRPPTGTSVDSASQRKLYRTALLQRCRAIPASRRPCQNWNADLWATILGVTEPYQGADLMKEIFDRSRPDVLALKQDDRWKLEDVFWSAIRSGDPTVAQNWLDQLAREEKDGPRHFHWLLERVDFLMNDHQDLVQARRAAESLREPALAAGLDGTVRWLVRCGDIERLAGNVDAARRQYTEAADRFRSGKTDWRAETVREAAYYEMVRSQLDQDALTEAGLILRKWEIEFPLSKLEGDFPLMEAQFWMAIDRYDLAVRELQAYRKAVRLSNFLPDAMKLELDCLLKLNRYDDLKALADDITKRFPNIELAQRAKDLVEELKPKPKTTEKNGAGE